MNKKSLLAEEDLKEIELFNTLPYDELVGYIENKPLNEATMNDWQKLDMTYEEFISTYEAVDLGEFLSSFDIKM